MQQDVDDNKFKVGSDARDFSLPGIDGREYSLDDFDKDVLVVYFTCNHCPYARAYHDRVVELQNDYDDVDFVAINSNDAEGYPEDSLEKMKERIDEFNHAYLRDEDQSVASAYGAQLTPEAFVFDKDRKLRYHGRIDDNWKDASAVTREDLREAIEAVRNSEEVENPENSAIGCSIKWLG